MTGSTHRGITDGRGFVGEFVQELLATTIEEIVEMYELSGGKISDTGVEKLVRAKHLLTEVLEEVISNN